VLLVILLVEFATLPMTMNVLLVILLECMLPMQLANAPQVIMNKPLSKTSV